MAYMTIKRVSVQNLKSFGPTNTELQAKEVGEFSVMIYGKMGWGRSLAQQDGCCKINVWRSTKNLNSRNFCIYWCINLKLAEIFKYRVIYIVLKFCKKSLIQIFDDVIANHE